MATITRGAIPRLLQEGVQNIYGTEIQDYDPIWSKLYRKLNSTKAYEVAVQLEGFGVANSKDEGDDISFDTRKQGFAPKYVHTAYAKGFVMSYEAMRDEQYSQFTEGARSMFRAMRITKELQGAYLFNNAFTTVSTMPGGDGLAMCSTAHINGPSSGSWSNRLAIDADFSEASLEDMLKLIGRATDARGLPIALQATYLVGHTDQQFEFQRVLQSSLQNDTVNNAINAVKSMGAVAKGFVASPYIGADTDAWFLLTDAPNGLKMYQRDEIMYGEDESFASLNMRYRAYERYSFGYDDPRGVFGTAGA